jgi:hypothetical protein
MATINQFTKQNLQQIRLEMEAAIANVCENYGIEPSTLGGIRYNTNSFTTSKMTFQLKSTTEKVKTANPEDLIGKRFKSGQRIFTINSVNSDGTLSSTTNRGARFKIRMDQITGMIQL